MMMSRSLLRSKCRKHLVWRQILLQHQFPCRVAAYKLLTCFFYTVYYLQDIRSLLEFFPKCLEEHASSSHPVVLVLDSLDQLSDDDGGRELEWVPKELPDNVYIILSTLPGKEYNCFSKLEVINLVVTSRYNRLFCSLDR